MSTTNGSRSGWCTPRGAGAHGTFTSYGSAAQLTRARFLATAGDTPGFVRFSTVVGSRGSADTVRDTRGFATTFSTAEGTFDLVGTNMPVFLIQDGIKSPDVIHAAKPHPDVEIPQAQTAHDTFWGFARCTPRPRPRVLGDDRPGNPAVVPDDRGVRRPRVPARRRRRRHLPGEVPPDALGAAPR
jgi:hypothetical protein